MKHLTGKWSLLAGAALVCGLCACEAEKSPEPNPTVVGTDERGNALATRVAVFYTAGKPVVGALVEARSANWLDGEPLDSVGGSPSAAQARTGADGTCQILLSERDSQIVRAGDDRFAAAVRTRATRPKEIKLVLVPTGTIQGAATRYGSQSQVRLRGLSGRTWTDAKGRFSLPGVPAGVFRLVIDAAAPIRLDTTPSRSGVAVRLIEPQIAGPNPIVTFRDTTLPPVPTISPAGGSFAGTVSVSVKPGDPLDAVETSTDGVKWVASTGGTITVSASGCIQARSLRSGQIMSQTVRACFEIGS